MGNGLPVAVSLAEAAGEILAEAWSCFKSSAARKCSPEAEAEAEAAGFVEEEEEPSDNLPCCI